MNQIPTVGKEKKKREEEEEEKKKQERLSLKFEEVDKEKERNSESYTSERVKIVDPRRFLDTQKKILKSTIRERNVKKS